MTNDKASDFLISERIGRTRHLTPDGFLLCTDVRIASTKPLLYAAHEMKKCRPQHGMVLMDRPSEVLFSQDTINSFNGKPITNDHPPKLVGPKQWKQESVGVVLNPRPGTGDDEGFLLADMLITDEKAIQAVEDGKIEVSCGYDQEHAEVKPGWGRFTKIIGNHVALVQKGRCGPQCAIGDEEMTAKQSIFERLRTAFHSKDERVFDSAIHAAEDAFAEDAQRVLIEVGAPAHDATTTQTVTIPAETKPALDADALKTALDAALAPILERITKLEFRGAADAHATATSDASESEKKKKEEAEKEQSSAGETKTSKECKDETAATGDADALDAMTLGALRLEFRDAVSKAEILSPGIKLPTFDGTCNSKKTIADQMCGLRKAALDAALKDPKRADHVKKVVPPNVTTDQMSCDQLTMAFNCAAEIARVANNAPKVAFDHQLFPGGPMTAERLQAINVAARRKSA